MSNDCKYNFPKHLERNMETLDSRVWLNFESGRFRRKGIKVVENKDPAVVRRWMMDMQTVKNAQRCLKIMFADNSLSDTWKRKYMCQEAHALVDGSFHGARILVCGVTAYYELSGSDNLVHVEKELVESVKNWLYSGLTPIRVMNYAMHFALWKNQDQIGMARALMWHGEFLTMREETALAERGVNMEEELALIETEKEWQSKREEEYKGVIELIKIVEKAFWDNYRDTISDENHTQTLELVTHVCSGLSTLGGGEDFKESIEASVDLTILGQAIRSQTMDSELLVDYGNRILGFLEEVDAPAKVEHIRSRLFQDPDFSRVHTWWTDVLSFVIQKIDTLQRTRISVQHGVEEVFSRMKREQATTTQQQAPPQQDPTQGIDLSKIRMRTGR
jgi:hypothetical protein